VLFYVRSHDVFLLRGERDKNINAITIVAHYFYPHLFIVDAN